MPQDIWNGKKSITLLKMYVIRYDAIWWNKKSTQSN